MFNWMFEIKRPKQAPVKPVYVPKKYNLDTTTLTISLDSFGKRKVIWYFDGEFENTGYGCFVVTGKQKAKAWLLDSGKTGFLETEENEFVTLDKIYGVKLETEDYWVEL